MADIKIVARGEVLLTEDLMAETIDVANFPLIQVKCPLIGYKTKGVRIVWEVIEYTGQGIDNEITVEDATHREVVV